MRHAIPVLIACAAFMLSACATTTPLDGEARPVRQSGMYAVATLAPWGSFEHEVAPAYTRLAMARRLAAHRLDAGRISVDQARAVQAAADRARAALDAARERGDAGDRSGARQALTAVVKAIEGVEQLARGEP